MKNIIIMLFMASNMAFSQSPSKMDSLVKTYLFKAQDIKDINTLFQILDKDIGKYTSFFNYLPSINPLNPKNQKRVSSTFGKRFHPIDKKVKAHYGIDISAPAGTPIHATASGVVKRTVISNTGYGNQVVIKHDFGFSSRYAHMYVLVVKEGFKVSKGDIIGFVGSTGKSTGNHIHFEILKNNVRIDPYPFFSLKFE